MSRSKSAGKSSGVQRPKPNRPHSESSAQEFKPNHPAAKHDNSARSVRETQYETGQLMMPQHANLLGNVFGGVVLSMMDTTAAVAAIRHARRVCVTVSVDRVDFRKPIHVGDLVIMKSSVNYVGRTSMEIGVRVETENLRTGARVHTNSCYLTFVAVDESGKSVPVPPLKLETPTEIRRHQAAKERRERRLHERTVEEKAEGDRASEERTAR